MIHSLKSIDNSVFFNEGKNTKKALRNITFSLFQELDISDVSRKDYIYSLKRLFEYIKEHQLSEDILLRFKRHLTRCNHLSGSSKNKYFTAAKVFFRELYRQGYLEKDISDSVKGFQQNKKHVRTGLDETEIMLISKYCNHLNGDKYNTRLRVIMSLLVYQGLRQIEIIRLDVEDIDLNQSIAFIQGKGQNGKEMIHIHPSCVKSLKKYLKIWDLSSGPLFISTSNNSFEKRLSTKSIRSIVTTVMHGLSINKSPHAFRHHFTTKLVREFQGNLLMVSKFTRHKSLEMLQVYYDDVLQRDELKRYYKTFNDVKI